MFIPSVREKALAISDIVVESYDARSRADEDFDSDRMYSVAKTAISTIMPELVDMTGERVKIEAYRGISIDEAVTTAHDGIYTVGSLRRIMLQKRVETVDFGELEYQSQMVDVCAVITPHYKDPDPVDLVFADELVVPFVGIQELRLE